MGTLNLAAPLVLFEKSRLWAGTRFHLLPSFHHHPTRNVVCPSGAWFENRPHLTPSTQLAWNPKHVIVHWNTHTLYWYIEPQQSHMRFSFSMADIYRAMSKIVSGPRPTWTTMSSGNHIYHERHLSGRVQCSHRATSDEMNHEIRQPHIWANIWVHITLPSVGKLKHRKFSILTTMVSDIEKQWTLNCINNSGIWGPTRHLSLKNN